MIRTLPAPTALALTGVLIAACSPAANNKFQQDVRYRHPEYPYELQAHGTVESPAVMLGGQWHPDALVIGNQTFEGYESSRPTKRVKQHYDWNQDGAPDHSEDVPQYDVRFVHDTGATVTIRAVPVPEGLATRSLGELADAYVDAITHTGDGEPLFRPEDLITKEDASFEVRVLDEATCRVSGVEAYRLEIVGHRTLPEPSAEQRVRLVVVRPGYKHKVQGADGREVLVMLVAAYSHTPEDFDSLEDDFNRFLNSWVLGGYGSAVPTERLGHTCQP